MKDLKDFIQKANIPDQLKEYFYKSKSIHTRLNEEKILTLEELFIYFDSIYNIDTSDFSAVAITALKRKEEFDSFYHYLKKVIENTITLKTKHSTYREDKFYIQIEKSLIDTTFKEVTNTFINNINKLLAKDDIGFSSIYKDIGKLELILEITNDDYIENLKLSGEKLITEYLDNLVEDNK